MAEKSVSIVAVLKDSFTPAAKQITSALGTIQKAAGHVRQAFAPLASTWAGIASGVAVMATARKAIELGQQALTASERLQVALRDNALAFEQIREQAQSIADRTVFDDDDILATAETLLQRGVAVRDLAKAIEASVEVSSALQRPLESVSEQIAMIFNGRIPRELAYIIPELRRMKEGAVDAQQALDLLMDRFRGQAERFRNTDVGRLALAQRRLNDAMEEFGKKLLPIKATVMEAMAAAVDRMAQRMNDPVFQKFLDTMREIGVFAAENAEKIIILVGTLQGLSLAGGAIAGVKQLWAALALIGGMVFTVKGAIVGLSVVALASFMEFYKKVASLFGTAKIGFSDLITLVGGLWARLRDGSTTFGELVGYMSRRIGGFFAGLGVAIYEYLWNLPRKVVTEMLDWAMRQALIKLAELKTAAMGVAYYIPGLGVKEQDVAAAVRAEQDLKAAEAQQSLGANLKAILDASNANIASWFTWADDNADQQLAEKNRLENERMKRETEEKKKQALDKQKAQSAANWKELTDWYERGREAMEKGEKELAEKRQEIRAKAQKQERDNELAHVRTLYELRLISAKDFLKRQRDLMVGGADQDIADLNGQALAMRARLFVEQWSGKDPAETQKRLLEIEGKLQEAYQKRKQAINEIAAAYAKLPEEAAGRLKDEVELANRLANSGVISTGTAQKRIGVALKDFEVQITATAESIDGQIADGILSADDAAILKQRLKETAEEARLSAEAAATGVRPLVLAQREASLSLMQSTRQALDDFMFRSIKNAKNMKEAFSAMLESISDAMLRLVTGRIAEKFIGMLAGGKNGGGIFAFFGKGATPMAEGGPVGGSGTGDIVPAMLDPREYVLTPKMVQALGVGNLESLRRRLAGLSNFTFPTMSPIAVPIPFAEGGPVGESRGGTGQAVLVADRQTFERMLAAGGGDALMEYLYKHRVIGG